MPKDTKVSNETLKEETVTPTSKKVVVVEELNPVEEPVKNDVLSTNLNEADITEEKTNYLWIIIPTALLVGILVGGLITYFSGLSRISKIEPTPVALATSTPQVEAIPSVTPVASVKKDTIKIQVLNGSGVSGAANKAKTLLISLGYKLIDTGNATSSDFVKTEVATKEKNSVFLNLVLEDLSKDYDATESSKLLPENSNYDVVITLGKK